MVSSQQKIASSAPGAAGADLPAPVLAAAAARELPLDRAPVRAGRGGGPARLGAGADPDRRRGSRRLGPRRGHPARGAYKELVARVCLGEVGAIFGLEVSRLARSSAETQRLLEYCGLTDTLVIDTDGIYDLRDFNDQLILGVKGQLVAGRAARDGRAAAGRQAPRGRARRAARCRCRSATSTTRRAR